MKVFQTTDFEGHWPVGSAAVVVAKTHAEAVELLDKKLREEGLKFDGKPENVVEVDLGKRGAIVLCNGDY